MSAPATYDAVPVYCCSRAHPALVLVLTRLKPCERGSCSRVCRAWRAAALDPVVWHSLSDNHRGFCAAKSATSERDAVRRCELCAVAAAAADNTTRERFEEMDYRRSHAVRSLLFLKPLRIPYNTALTGACGASWQPRNV